MNPYIHSLHVYPIKSCQGIDLDSAELTTTGIRYDRHWMLIDKQGQFLSQRQLPAMALVKTEFNTDELLVTDAQGRQLEIPLQQPQQNRQTVKIWKDECQASLVSQQASRWFSEALDTDCDLVYLPQTEQRKVDTNYAREGQIVGFADGFPLLILSRAVINVLNDKLEDPVNINRFRANIIIDGCEAHAEDQWQSITVNNIEILLAKPCSRCVIPSIHQHTAEKHATILRTLAGYRRGENGKVYMGQNGLHKDTGWIRVGQPVTAIRR